MAAPRQGKSRREHTQAHIEQIQTSAIINRLNDHIHGKAEMKSTQVNAAIALLRKTLPDRKATELEVDADITVNVMSYVNSHPAQ